MPQIFLNSYYGRKLNGVKNSVVEFEIENVSFNPYDDIFLSLENAIIPISNYLINENNNILIINNITYTITEGNYNITELINQLITDAPVISTIQFNKKTNKLFFTFLSQNIVIAEGSTILNVLGFSNTNHITNNFSIESDNVIDLSGNNMLYVSIDEIQTENILISKRSNVIASMPIDVNFGDLYTYVNINKINSRVYLNSINLLTVRILDENLNEINLNNKEWNISISILSYFNKDKFDRYQILKNYLEK